MINLHISDLNNWVIIFLIRKFAIGVYTYFTSKLGIGLKQLLAGARKFKLNLLDREDIAAISQRAINVCKHWDLGIKSQEELDMELVKKEIYSGIYD